ncbi:hypothetical protein BP6252_01038 [Coleophoma cylindrospora]|uniref:Uncharacterized protein n=1 Tax=Coleophoma cylindrospora TaxID=1849047 RepID=A0A3D8SRR7_9HELO|nr:hypothetical protein BP6252_01038 [Coleophoma cylindrospora]
MPASGLHKLDGQLLALVIYAFLVIILVMAAFLAFIYQTKFGINYFLVLIVTIMILCVLTILLIIQYSKQFNETRDAEQGLVCGEGEQDDVDGEHHVSDGDETENSELLRRRSAASLLLTHYGSNQDYQGKRQAPEASTSSGGSLQA